MSGSADAAPGYAPGPRAGHDLAGAAPPASGSPAARDGVDAADGESQPDLAAGEDEPFDGDGDEGGRYVPL
jgi:hypothetical protein